MQEDGQSGCWAGCCQGAHQVSWMRSFMGSWQAVRVAGHECVCVVAHTPRWLHGCNLQAKNGRFAENVNSGRNDRIELRADPWTTHIYQIK
jgi:hypothetical protein